MTVPPPRSRAQRRADTLTKLETEVDLWVASADEAGVAYLVPLSFHWDGEALTLATATRSRTGRNLLRAGWARVALGPTRDVVMIEGPLEAIPVGTDPELESAYARSAGWDPCRARRTRLPALDPAERPGVARVERAHRPPPDARRRVA